MKEGWKWLTWNTFDHLMVPEKEAYLHVGPDTFGTVMRHD